MELTVFGEKEEVYFNDLSEVIDEINNEEVSERGIEIIEERVEKGRMTLEGGYLALRYMLKDDELNERYANKEIDIDEILDEIGLEIDDQDYEDLQAIILEDGLLNSTVIATMLKIKGQQERIENAEALNIEKSKGDSEL
ncbi:MAG: hypothetical protein AWU54_437 [Candidatus Frackibacter sp. T328-2]|nr:MAG: hypothetical protein AWU54_437 [Candidatus Frackibacter sp. T328-2]